MKYTTIKKIQIIFAAGFMILLGLIMMFLAPKYLLKQMVLPIILLCALLFPIFYLDHIEKRQYPQWENLWRIPWPLTVLMSLLIIVMGFLSFLDQQHIYSWMIVPIVCTKCITELYFAIKYDMDNVYSLEGLLEAHPEARGNLRRVILGG